MVTVLLIEDDHGAAQLIPELLNDSKALVALKRAENLPDALSP
jgi:hypothetical protein